MLVAVLQSSNAPSYRALMLEADEIAADAYTSTAAERASEPETFWIKLVADPTGLNAVFGAFEGQELIGTAALGFTADARGLDSGARAGGDPVARIAAGQEAVGQHSAGTR